MRSLDALLISRQRQFLLDQPAAFLFSVCEVAEQHLGVGMLEIVGRLLPLVLQEDVAIGQRHVRVGAIVGKLVDRLLVEQVHGQPLEAVGDLAGDEIDLDAAHLLEVGELRDLHAVAPDFPAQPPGTQGRALPVILDEADVVQRRVDADRLQRPQVAFEDVGRRRLQDRLELIIVLQPHRIFAVAPVTRTARRLHIGRVPGLRPQRPQCRRGVEGTGAHLHVEGLENQAALGRPIILQGQNQFLKARRLPACC